LFIPATADETRALGWDRLDVIIVSGDAYIDSPFIGASVIGHVLMSRGYRVGIIPQPDLSDERDILRFGEPLLFWGVTSGSIDSMISNYTASGKRRKMDDLTPGGVNDRRPDRALIAYCNHIRRYCKETAPIVIGGIEASLRRIAHYDAWDNAVRRSVLFDSRADILVYGMGELAVTELARRLRAGEECSSVPGTCHIEKNPPPDCLHLPSFEDVRGNPDAFIEMFAAFYKNCGAHDAQRMCQKHGDRFLVHNPPMRPLAARELDEVYALPYELMPHPIHENEGKIRATDTINFSITTHRGCYGECSFCAIAVHQGRSVVSRSEDSIIEEAKRMTAHPGFRGVIQDVGGPTANMYMSSCGKSPSGVHCAAKSCLHPSPCKNLSYGHAAQISLLCRLRELPGVKKVFVNSGVRHDLVLADKDYGRPYLEELVRHHVSGQMKLAPEHSVGRILALMKKPPAESLVRFKRLFDSLNAKLGKKQFLTYYFIAAHPGCDESDMLSLKKFIDKNLRIKPEQVQIFTPSPSTHSTAMYYAEKDPEGGKPLFVEKNTGKKIRQKSAITRGSRN